MNTGDAKIASCPDMPEPHCYIEMSSFWDGEFKMDQGTYITVKLSPMNNKGWSSASKWNIEGQRQQNQKQDGRQTRQLL